MIRKAVYEDIKKVVAIYDEILTVEESAPPVAGWKRGVYPTPQVAQAGYENDEMFVLEKDGEIVGSMILNKRQDAHYPLGNWQYDAEYDEVMVLHTFVVSPRHARKGYAGELFLFYEEYAVKCGCKYLRFSTNRTNSRARNFYKKMNVTEACELDRGGGKYSVLLEKKLDTFIRKAENDDVSAVAGIYERIHDCEEKGECTTGWIRGVYPTKNTALTAYEDDELYVMVNDGKVVASARLNKKQDDMYKDGNWQYDAKEDEVMVMHTLTVDPEYSSRGFGKLFAGFYEYFAGEHNCNYLRIDTNAKNTKARKLYDSFGYNQVGTVNCVFNGIEGVELVLLEKRL